MHHMSQCEIETPITALTAARGEEKGYAGDFSTLTFRSLRVSKMRSLPQIPSFFVVSLSASFLLFHMDLAWEDLFKLADLLMSLI